MEEHNATPRVILEVETLYEHDCRVIELFEQLHPGMGNISLDQRLQPLIEHNYHGRKNKDRVRKIRTDKGFITSLKPKNEAMHAIHSMRSHHNLDVNICISRIDIVETLHEKIDWILSKLGKDWLSRIIICPDKSFLQCDIFVDLGPRYSNYNEEPQTVCISGKPPTCKRYILFDEPYNRKQDPSIPRLKGWHNWKEVFELDQLKMEEVSSTDSISSLKVENDDTGSMDNVIYFRHGSQDSKDEDRLYLFPKMPSHKDCLRFTTGTADDRNIFIMKDGFVSECFKGYPDEINNALLQTYSYHPQKYELPIKARVGRVVALKVTGGIHAVLVKVRRVPSFRESIVKALHSMDFEFHKRTLSKLNFMEATEMIDDDYKYVAFQIGQALALVDGKEVFTKQDIAKLYPELQPFLNRDMKSILSNLKPLNDYRDKLLEKIKPTISRTKDGILHLYTNPKNVSEWNAYTLQARGLVIDYKLGRVINFPFQHPSNAYKADWNLDQDDIAKNLLMKEGSSMISMSRVGDQLHVYGETDFNDKAVDNVRKYFMKSDIVREIDNDYTYILEVFRNEITLIGVRNRITQQLGSNDDLKSLSDRIHISCGMESL